MIEDKESMTFDKVIEFIDCLPLSKMDKHELKSMISDLENDSSSQAYQDGYIEGLAIGARDVKLDIKKRAEYMKQYRSTHKKKIAEIQARCYYAHQEDRIQYARDRRAEKIKEKKDDRNS